MNQKPKSGRFATRKGWILITVLVVVIVVLAVLLLLTRAAGQSPYTNKAVATGTVAIPAADSDHAMRYDLAGAADAEAYFQRLLDSQYIGLHGDVAEPAELVDGKWHLREENGDGTELTAVFDKEGVITSLYIGTNLGGTMKNSPDPYTLTGNDESLYQYVRSFAYAYLPDVAIMSGNLILDQYNDEGRFVTLHLNNNDNTPVYAVVVQVEPMVRIVSFSLLVDEETAMVRTSRMAGDTETAAEPFVPTQDEAIALARSALASSYDIPQREVDGYTLVAATYYDNAEYEWCGFTIAGPFWVVSFHMPDTNSNVYSDYDVFINAETGEVEQILDPSNNSNG